MRPTYDPEEDALAIVLGGDLLLEDSADLAEGVTKKGHWGSAGGGGMRR